MITIFIFISFRGNRFGKAFLTCLAPAGTPNSSSVPPVRAIEEYVAYARARKLGISLTQGYFCRPTDPIGHVIDKPLSTAAAENRLKLYLKEAPIDTGETLHSFHSGCALTLAFSGSALATSWRMPDGLDR